MPSRRLAALAVVTACALSTVGLPASQAASEHTIETGTVTYIYDGDTVEVDLVGAGSEPVRLLGVQAMEAEHPSTPGSFDQCHAAAARERLRALVDGKTVQLRAMSASSTSRGRLHRSVWVQRSGVWTDVQRILLEESLVLPLPSGSESTHNIEYLKLAQQVSQDGQGIWNTVTCGSGPSQDIPLRVIVHWDADGNDNDNNNDEWVSVENTDPSQTLSLSGWWIRDSSLTFYTFPSGTSVAPGSRVLVRVGKGSSSATTKYWGNSDSVFDNAGDGVYLFDPKGDLRAWMIYPCLTACSDAEKGNLSITKVSYDPAGSDADNVNGEYVKITNTSTHTVSMRPYMIRSWPYTHTFGATVSIAAGATLTLKVGSGKATSATKYWGKKDPILNNGGDVVEIVTYTDVQLACKAWGSKSC